jgi:colanic acid/amylovoran biosynthesis glycosyltransferase
MTLNKREYVCAHYLANYLPITENWIYKLISNHQVFSPVVIARKTSNLESFPFNPIFELNKTSPIKLFYNYLIFKLLGYFPGFVHFCKKWEVDILHIHFGYHGIKSLRLKKKLKIPMVCSFYGDDVYSWTQKKWYRSKILGLFHEADVILVLGSYMKDYLMNLGCPEDKIRIHHLGVNVNKIRFEHRKYSAKKPINFLIASSFVPKKGIDIALKAISLVRDQINFMVYIIGGGPLKNNITDLVKELNIEDKVKFYGYQSYDYFLNLAYKCDAFLHASRTGEKNQKEGTPMALVDVMATGLPVVATFHSDIPEIVLDGENGYLAKENSVEDFAKAIMRFVKEYKENKFLAENGRKHIEENFNSEIQSSSLEKIYLEILNKQISKN